MGARRRACVHAGERALSGSALRREIKLWQQFAEQSLDHAIVLLDAGGRIEWWSPGAEHIFGYTPDEIVGQPGNRLFTAEDIEKGLPEHEVAVAIDHGSGEDDRWMERKDGSRFWASGLLVSIRDEDGSLAGFVKLLRNRTEVQEQLETLRNLAQVSDQENRRKDVFLSTLSHELRNPLAPLANAVAIIRMGGPTSPEMEYGLKVVERQVDSLRRLVDDLLDLSRIGAGKIHLQRTRVPLHELVDAAVEATMPLITERRHRLEVLLPPVAIEVDADRDRIVQVFVNLLTNAAKYTPTGGSIWIKATTEGREVVIRFSDTGVGIPPDMLARVFEMFTQVESSRALAHGGLGIGLALVKTLVTEHGGSVQVQSEGTGKGSEFTVRLPLPA